MTKQHKNLFTVVIIAVVAFIPYSNSFETSFQLDDYHTILKNKQIGNYDKYLNIDSWKKLIYNRQIPYLTFSLNYSFGKYDLFGYHLFNIIIHIFNSILVFLLVRKLFLTSIIASSRFKNHSSNISLFTALIFAVHPVQVQAVTYITQRMVSLAVMFYLLSVLFYISGRLENRKLKLVFFVLSFLSFVLGVFSKEIIFSLPLALIATEFFFFRDNNKINNKYLFSLIAITITATLIFLIKYGIPKQAEATDHVSYFLTQLYTQTIYIRLLFLPFGQHLYYNIPVSSSIFDLDVLLGLAVFLVVLAITIVMYKEYRLISFGILWFYITLSIESSFFPLKFLFFEYRLYPAVFGYALTLVCTLYFLKEKTSPTVVKLILSAIVIVYGYLTYQHNKVWKDPVTLWTNNVIESPYNKEAHKNLGVELMTRGRMKEAYISFTRSIELDSNYAVPFAHRAVLLNEHSSFQSALFDANKAITLDSNKALYFNNRGFVFQSAGEYESAIKDFKKAIELERLYDNAIKNLSVVYLFQNKLDDALIYANRSIELVPEKADYFNNRGNIYFALNKLIEAEKDFRKAFEISPNFAKAANNIGVVNLKLNKLDEAIIYFTKSLEIDDKFIDSYYYRGYCLIQKGMFELAYNDLRQCILLSPQHTGAISLFNQYFARKN